MDKRYIPLLLAGALTLFSIWQISEAPQKFTPPSNTTFEEHIREAQKTLQKVDSLLAVELEESKKSFTLKAPSPFGDKKRTVTPRKTSTLPAFERTPLRLKGILEGGQVLALLENSQGRTFIVAKGDTLFDRKVYNIKKSAVILRDRSGLDTLKVSD